MARRQGRGSASAALAVVTVLALLQSALATNYPINGDGTWGFGKKYQTWADGVSFKVGDSLEFKYGSGFHSVFQLASKTAFDNCDISSPQKQWKSGDDTVPLTAAGTAYFVCGISGHCAAGMKFSVDVIPGQTANPPTSTAPPTSPATPPVTPPTTTPPTTPPTAPPPTTTPTTPPTAPPTTTPSKALAKAPSSPLTTKAPTARGPAPPPESSAASVKAALLMVAGAVALAMLV